MKPPSTRSDRELLGRYKYLTQMIFYKIDTGQNVGPDAQEMHDERNSIIEVAEIRELTLPTFDTGEE